MQWTATQSRHWGHSSHFIVQSAIQIAPIIREQCARVFLFAAGRKAGKTLAEEFNAPELENCVSLVRGEYFQAIKGGACTFHSTKRKLSDALSTYARGRGIVRVGRVAEEEGGRQQDTKSGDVGSDRREAGSGESGDSGDAKGR